MTILIIEDDEFLIRAIQAQAERIGFHVLSAQNSNEGLRQLESKGSDIAAVWLDHTLCGRESGLDFVAQAKKYMAKQKKRIPIFVVTNTATAPTLREYKRLGAYKCYVKVDHRLSRIFDDIKDAIAKR